MYGAAVLLLFSLCEYVVCKIVSIYCSHLGIVDWQLASHWA